jgi:large subunit ribosomal protein L13
MKKYTIDAKGMKLGRLAADAAKLLMGKNLTDFARNAAPDVEVLVVNASKINITDKKKISESFTYYSGYPGGLRKESLDSALEKKGIAEVLRKTINGMLPKNKLRSQMIKKLKVTE